MRLDRRVEPRERVLLRIQVPDVLDPSIEEPERFTGQMGNNYAKNEEGKLVQLTIRIFVTYTGKESLRNVTLSIDTPNGIVPSAASVLVPSVGTYFQCHESSSYRKKQSGDPVRLSLYLLRCIQQPH